MLTLCEKSICSKLNSISWLSGSDCTLGSVLLESNPVL